jgi:hypothetical protein
MKTFGNNIAALTLTLFVGSFATAQTTTSTDITCRTKAKDVAAQAYAACMGSSQTSQLEQVRKEYQKQLAELKSHYDQELKKIGASRTTPATPATSKLAAPRTATTAASAISATPPMAAAPAMPVTPVAARGAVKTKSKKSRTKSVATTKTHAPKPTKGIATSLPTRTETTQAPDAAGPITSEDITVVSPHLKSMSVPPANSTGTTGSVGGSTTSPNPTGDASYSSPPEAQGPDGDVPALPSSDDNEAAQNEMQLTLVPATSGLTQ